MICLCGKCKGGPEIASVSSFTLSNGAVQRASGGNDGGGNDSDGMQSFNPQGEEDFLFQGVPPLQGDEKLGGVFTLEATT